MRKREEPLRDSGPSSKLPGMIRGWVDETSAEVAPRDKSETVISVRPESVKTLQNTVSIVCI